MSQPDDLLGQATSFLRAAPEPGWDAIADRVIAAVRTTPRRGGWPLRAQTPPPDSGQIHVSDHVVRSTLVVVLRQQYVCAPTAIEFDIHDEAIRAVHIEITGSYGTELHALAQRIRATTIDTITELLGATVHDRGPIDVTVTDVVLGDPLHL
jgi:hypothetical protein